VRKCVVSQISIGLKICCIGNGGIAGEFVRVSQIILKLSSIYIGSLRRSGNPLSPSLWPSRTQSSFPLPVLPWSARERLRRHRNSQHHRSRHLFRRTSPASPSLDHHLDGSVKEEVDERPEPWQSSRAHGLQLHRPQDAEHGMMTSFAPSPPLLDGRRCTSLTVHLTGTSQQMAFLRSSRPCSLFLAPTTGAGEEAARALLGGGSSRGDPPPLS
jgi:hypothetical protein